MKQNKEIKVGDKIWLCCACLSRNDGFTVKSVKKEKTCVTVVINGEYIPGKEYDVMMYGHASSSILSGFDKKWAHRDIFYTCDYSIIERKTEDYKRDERRIEAGMALLKLANLLK